MPAFAINEFRNVGMAFDGARPNLFEVIINFPSSIPGGTLSTAKLAFTCKTVQLPGSTIGIAPVQYFGREIKLAGNRTFADWTVTVLNDEDFLTRSTMEKWMDALNGHANNVRRFASAAPGAYTADATVIHYSKVGAPLRTYKFTGMFPTDITPIDLDWGSNDTIEEYSVTFAYQWWEANGVGGAVG